MWRSLISLSNEVADYGDFIEKRLAKIQGLSFVAENCNSRVFYHLAASDYETERIKSQVLDIVAEVVLVRAKLDYLLKNLSLSQISLPIGALLSSLIYFESHHEKKFLLNALSKYREYSIDGIVNFRIGKLKKGWDELATLTKSFLQLKCKDKEVFNLIMFMANNSRQKKQTLLIADDGEGIVLTNVSQGCVVEVCPVFCEKCLDIVNAVLSQNPTELIIEGKNCDKTVYELLKNFLKIKMF